MIFIFDFDGVIFDLNEFKRSFQNVFIKNGVSREFIQKYYSREYPRPNGNMSKSFYLMVNTREVLKNFEVDIHKIYMDLDVLFARAPDYLYQDFIYFYNQYKNSKIILLTYGCSYWQQLKIFLTGIDEIFQDNIIITYDKVSEIFKLLKSQKIEKEKTVFIDDTALHIDGIKNNIPQITTFWMCRTDESRPEKISQKADFRSFNFYEVEKIIQNS